MALPKTCHSSVGSCLRFSVNTFSRASVQLSSLRMTVAVGEGGLGWEASRLSPAEPHHNDTHACAPHLEILTCSLPIQVFPHSPGLSWGCTSSARKTSWSSSPPKSSKK